VEKRKGKGKEYGELFLFQERRREKKKNGRGETERRRGGGWREEKCLILREGKNVTVGTTSRGNYSVGNAGRKKRKARGENHDEKKRSRKFRLLRWERRKGDQKRKGRPFDISPKKKHPNSKGRVKGNFIKGKIILMLADGCGGKGKEGGLSWGKKAHFKLGSGEKRPLSLSEPMVGTERKKKASSSFPSGNRKKRKVSNGRENSLLLP